MHPAIYQLKQKGKNKELKEIVRIMNTQKLVTTTMKGQDNQAIKVVRCGKPTQEIAAIYEILKYKSTPVKKRKFVIPPK